MSKSFVKRKPILKLLLPSWAFFSWHVSVSCTSKQKTKIYQHRWIFNLPDPYKTKSSPQVWLLFQPFSLSLLLKVQKRGKEKKPSFAEKRVFTFVVHTGGYLNILSKFSLFVCSELVFVHVFFSFLEFFCGFWIVIC